MLSISRVASALPAREKYESFKGGLEEVGVFAIAAMAILYGASSSNLCTTSRILLEGAPEDPVVGFLGTFLSIQNWKIPNF